MAGLILSVGCRVDCYFVVGFVAGKSASLLPGNADIYRLCCYFLTTDNESNKKFKENRKSKNNKPDIRLQVLWCPLPDFVADSLCSAFFMEVMLMAKNKTSIKVTAVFDGELDATDVFVSLIAQQYAGQYAEKYHDKGSENIHSENVYSKNISKDFLAKSQETAYNDSEVQKSQPSGLCG